jgi:predicted Abi (CAAX) family protease
MEQFWQLVGGALSLNPEAFTLINNIPDGTQVALFVVLVAGLAQAIGQCIVLFVNKVPKIRFFFSLFVSAVLFTFTLVFWGFSTWFIGAWLFRFDITPWEMVRTMGLSYAPEMFTFLVALPHIGIPISVILSIWSLLSLITGLQAITTESVLSTGMALACTGLGWMVLQLLQRTIGKPVTALGQALLNLTAGRQLIYDPAKLEESMAAGNPGLNQYSQVGEEILVSASTKNTTPTSPTQKYKTFIIIAFVVFLLIGLLSPQTQGIFFTWYNALGRTVKLIFDCLWISAIALIFAILLTPMEALSWWAGWYDDYTLDPGELVATPPPNTDIQRYVVYLDGINQGTYNYLPEVNKFLDELAEAVPRNIAIVKGIMPYSVTNRSLTEDRPLAFLWSAIDSLIAKNPNTPIGAVINLRNVAAVAVSADPRYGPIQNRGLAQVLLNSLLTFGYQIGSKTPVTLIGYSGGGQMSMGALPFLKKTIQAPMEVISLAGVISGDAGGAMEAEFVYHIVGEKDSVEKVGPLMFWSRWPVYTLSNWNQAKRRGKIIFIDLGPVGHNGMGGPMGDDLLPSGESHLQQTINICTGILLKDWALTGLKREDYFKTSNYQLYQQAIFNQHSHYPIQQHINRQLYQPVANWSGRLILPSLSERQKVKGVYLKLYHAPSPYENLIGKTVTLRWSEADYVQNFVQLVTNNVEFVGQASVSIRAGNIHPERINNWLNVDPLESLAASHPEDDIIVKLPEPVQVNTIDHDSPILTIEREPILITGRFYGVVTFLQSLDNDLYLVRHYNKQTGVFDGPTEEVLVPTVIPDRNGIYVSSAVDLHLSPMNNTGWYIYGEKDMSDHFVVRAIAPYELFSTVPYQVINGEAKCLKFINHEYWQKELTPKGYSRSFCLNPGVEEEAEITPKNLQMWQRGDRTLLIHLYGGIGGKIPELSPMGIFFGHFAYGEAQVILDPLTDQLRFEINYDQIYTHNTDGVVAGNNHWSHYMGDRQYGWLGVRPVADMLIKFSPLTEDYDFDGKHFSPLAFVFRELDVMAARYRIGDGTGTTFVSSVNSCVQDSSQALYVAMKKMVAQFQLEPLILKWLRENPDHEQAIRFSLLVQLVASLEALLSPTGKTRKDWLYSSPNLGKFPTEAPLQTLLKTMASWKSLLPRLAADDIIMILLQLGAQVWVIRTNQVGGFDPDVEAIAPTDFSYRVPKVKNLEY